MSVLEIFQGSFTRLYRGFVSFYIWMKNAFDKLGHRFFYSKMMTVVVKEKASIKREDDHNRLKPHWKYRTEVEESSKKCVKVILTFPRHISLSFEAWN